MRTNKSFLALLSFLRLSYASIGPTADLEISNQNIAPDGFSRSAVLAGGTFPGPLITANKGDTFSIDVTDSLTDSTMLRSTSIHWHGLFQNGTTEMDGVAFVSQCPLVPNESFTYQFSSTSQAGTFWYHSHLSTQYCDGLRGPLVIYDPNDPHKDLYDVDDNTTIITLSDWYHTPAMADGQFPIPDSNLINGLGRYPNGDADAPLAVINVEQGKRYRFRLISTACHPFYNFTIDGHNMTIIEVDGVNTAPLVVDNILIYAGQRYSFILDASQPVQNYWARANSNLGPAGFDGGLNSAILRYSGANDSDPTTQQPNSVLPLNEADLHPLENPGAPGTPGYGNADINLSLSLTFNGTAFFINGTSFTSPSIPVLTQILSGAQNATDLLPAGSVYTLERNKVVELTLEGGLPGGPHPFHLHGHNFDVVRVAGSSDFNYDNPVRRDVVSLGNTGDVVVFRFVTDNPGPWFLHCHIDWHLEAGLAIVLAEAPDAIASSNPVSTDWSNLCPTYNAQNPDSNS